MLRITNDRHYHPKRCITNLHETVHADERKVTKQAGIENLVPISHLIAKKGMFAADAAILNQATLRKEPVITDADPAKLTHVSKQFSMWKPEETPAALIEQLQTDRHNSSAKAVIP
jgi:hypothetical protein